MIYEVHPDKISRYLLNLSSIAGAPKARFFISRGFLLNKLDEFAAVLRKHPIEATLIRWELHPQGRKLVFQCSMWAADGTQPCIRTVWIEMACTDRTRLITAYPASPLKASAP